MVAWRHISGFAGTYLSMQRRFDLELIRVICVVIVVLYHTVTRIYSSDYACLLPGWLVRTMGSLIWLAVSMFLFISGFLFSRKVSRPWSVSGYWGLVRAKCRQLLVPYLIFSALLMIQGGWFSVMRILRGDFWHHWFLPALFLCFVCFYPLMTYVRDNRYRISYELLIMGSSFFLSFVKLPLWLQWGGLHTFFMWNFYFVLGCVVAGHEYVLANVMRKYHLWILLLTVWLIHAVWFPVNYWTVSWHNILAVSSALVSLLYLAGKINPDWVPVGFVKGVFAVGMAGMWIYVLHYWILIYTTSSTALAWASRMTDFEIYGTLMVFLIALITFALSYALTWSYFRVKAALREFG